MKLFNSLYGTIIFTLLSLLVYLAVSMFGVFFYLSYKEHKRDVASFRKSYVDERKQLIKDKVDRVIEYIEFAKSSAAAHSREEIKSRVYQAHASARAVYDRNTGRMPPGEIKKAIKEILRSIRFNWGKGYFFVVDMQGVFRLEVDNPEFEGRQKIDFKDADGSEPVRRMIDLVDSNGQGFLTYKWTKPFAKGGTYTKTAFVKYFQPFHWILGSGFYLDETELDVKNSTLKYIEKAGYEADDYLYVLNSDGMLLGHPISDLVGKPLDQIADTRRVDVIRQHLSMCEEAGEGFLTYEWMKPSLGRRVSKLSYVRSYPRWQWIVGTGRYLDDIEGQIADKSAEFKRNFFKTLFSAAFLLLLFAGIAVFFIVLFSKRVRGEFDSFKEFFTHSAEGNVFIDESNLAFREFAEVAVFANQMNKERGESERKLKESEEELRAIVKATPDPLVIYDKHGLPRYINPEFEKVFGWRFEEVRGARIPFVPADQMAITGQMIALVYRTDSPVKFETRRLTKDGRVVDVIVSAATIKGLSSNRVGLVVNLNDVTEAKKLEVQLQQARKMESVGTLAGGIAHDFNNILQAINGYTELMLISGTVTDADKKSLEKIQKASERGAALVKKLLLFSRKVDAQKKRLNVNREVEQAESILARTIPRMIDIDLRLADELWPVNADPIQIEQIFLNLGSNSADAMPDGGKIVIETANKTVESEENGRQGEIRPGNYVRITISDNGVGMDSETVAHIFDPFYTTKEIGKGTGLGLASVYGVVKNHGGYIVCRSEMNRGTVFDIYIPASPHDSSPDSGGGTSDR